MGCDVLESAKEVFLYSELECFVSASNRTRILYLLTLPGMFFFSHSPCNPDLAPNDFHLFTHMKQFLRGMGMGSDKEGG
jgi:hypothetical protein